MKAIVAILFVCLATGANAGCLDKLVEVSFRHPWRASPATPPRASAVNSSSKNNQREYDLWGLEKWLDEKAPIGRETDPELGYSTYINDQFRRRHLFDNGTQRVVDLEILRNNLGELEKQELEDTARLVVDVADLKECNQEVLVVLNELARAKIVYGGGKRTERILWKPLQALYKSCGEYVDEQLSSLAEKSLNEQQKEFVTLVADTGLWQVTNGYVPSPMREDHGKDMAPGIWNDFFRRLSQKDAKALVSERVVNGRTQQIETIHHRDRFNHVMKDYLVPSCKSLTAAVANKFNFVTLNGLGGVYSLGGMQQDNRSWDRFMSHRPRAVQSLTSAFNFCTALQSGQHKFNKMFEVIKNFDYSKMGKNYQAVHAV